MAGALARQRGFACFPCRLDKRPACPHGFQDASPDPQAIRALWRAYPGPLIGVATGAISGIDLLDVDCGDPPAGATPDHIAKVESARTWWAMRCHTVPRTLTYVSRSGGLHLYFTHDDRCPCTTSRIARGVDTRGTGGYAIWWFAAGCPQLDASGLAPWPERLLRELQPPVAASGRAAHDPSVFSDNALAGLLRAVATAPEGERNRVLHWAACRLGEHVREGRLAAGEAERILLAASSLPVLEARRTIVSGFRQVRAAG